MSYKSGDVSITFDNQYVIHGMHCTVDEANEILLDSKYPEVKAIEVEHIWATWGKLLEELAECRGDYGWWAIPEHSSYKHKKKMTFVVTEEYKRIEAAIQQRWQKRMDWQKRWDED